MHWTGERYDECAGDGCEHCSKGDGPKLRVAFNFYVPGDSEPKVFDGSKTWYMDVLKVRDKYGLDKWLFEIERHGEAGDPKTTYTILPEERLSDAQHEEIAALRLHDLPKVLSGDRDSFDSYDKDKGGRTIDGRTASELMPRLKALPRSALDTFLGDFGIQRVRDLAASDEKAARALLDRLEADGKPEEDTSIDPFA